MMKISELGFGKNADCSVYWKRDDVTVIMAYQAIGFGSKSSDIADVISHDNTREQWFDYIVEYLRKSPMIDPARYQSGDVEFAKQVNALSAAGLKKVYKLFKVRSQKQYHKELVAVYIQKRDDEYYLAARLFSPDQEEVFSRMLTNPSVEEFMDCFMEALHAADTN